MGITKSPKERKVNPRNGPKKVKRKRNKVQPIITLTKEWN